MIQIEHRGTIPAPPEKVFPILSDPQVQLAWDAGTLRSVEKLDDGPLRRGSRYRGKFKGYGAVTYEFIEFEANSRFAHLARIPLGRMRHTFVLEPQDRGTTVVQTGELEPNLLGRLMGGMFRRSMAKRFSTIVDEVSAYLAAHP